jgi:putative FmdB family regulatory protein
MPIYTYKCTQCNTQEDEIVKAGTESTECKECGAPTVKQPSFRFSAHGLPNGFASTRSQSRKD